MCSRLTGRGPKRKNKGSFSTVCPPPPGHYDGRMKTRTFLKTVFLSVFLAVLLGGCYMPIRFDAEIEITRGGYYDFKFDGYLAQVQLYQGLKEGKIGPEEEKKRIELIKTDFSRDPGFKGFKYIKLGHFKIYWERSGDLLKAKSVTFINLSEYILGLRYNSKTGRISMLGKSLSVATKKRLDKIGLGWTGQIRVFTDAKVITHNATRVMDSKRKGGKFKIFIWDLKNIFAPTPSLILAAG